MVIETAGRAYRVLLHQEESDERDVYLCEDTKDHSRRRLIALKDQGLMENALDFLYTQMRHPPFSDYEECFVCHGSLYLVFACPQGKALSDKLQSEKPNLMERMEIGKKVMERLILQSMDPYFLSQCLWAGRIFVTDSLEITFAYDIEHLQTYGEHSLQTVRESWKTLLSLMFGRELYLESIPPMKIYIHKLGEEHYQEIMDIYDGYMAACAEISQIPEDALTLPGIWGYRSWARVRKLGPPFKYLCAGVVFISVLAFLLWNIEQVRMPPEPVSLVSSIGTVTLDQSLLKEDVK